MWKRTLGATIWIWKAAIVAAFLLLFVAILLQIASRYIGGTGLLGTTEAAQIAFVWLIYLAGLAVLREETMIRMDIALEFVSTRVRHLLEIFFLALFGGTLALFLPLAIALLGKSYRLKMSITGLPYTVIYVAGALFILAALPISVLLIIEHLKALRK